MGISYSKFCEELGAPLHNVNWSWCAMTPEKRFALFTVWENQIVGDRYEFRTKPPASDVRKKAGRTELLRVLDTVITDGYAAYGIRCRAVDYQANPRKRKSFEIESLLDMRIRHIDNDYIGQIVGHIPAQVISERGNQASWIASTAINDIGQDEVGNVDPEYKRRMTGSYVRVPKVRDMVLKRAGGVCEYCGKRGFLKADGKIYLETHHVILLSEQGSDTLSNVIALCPNHHREAHFGDNWRSLQDEFLQIIKKLAQ